MVMDPWDPDALPPELNRMTYEIIGAAIKVHVTLGPGLLERVYHEALRLELEARGSRVETEVLVSASYEGKPLGLAYRIDLLVNDQVVVEVKSTPQHHPAFESQLLTLVRTANKPAGILLNFGLPTIKEGLDRKANRDALRDGTAP